MNLKACIGTGVAVLTSSASAAGHNSSAREQLYGSMLLKGACQCGSIRFQVSSNTPVPFMHCYCSICRKANGGGGYAINLGGEADSLKVEGKDRLKKYSAKIRKEAKVNAVKS